MCKRNTPDKNEASTRYVRETPQNKIIPSLISRTVSVDVKHHVYFK